MIFFAQNHFKMNCFTIDFKVLSSYILVTCVTSIEYFNKNSTKSELIYRYLYYCRYAATSAAASWRPARHPSPGCPPTPGAHPPPRQPQRVDRPAEHHEAADQVRGRRQEEQRHHRSQAADQTAARRLAQVPAHRAAHQARQGGG